MQRSRSDPLALYAGVAAFVIVAALTARSVWQAWQVRAGQARAEAVFRLVQQRTPPRPAEAPGAMAWLEDQLLAYTTRIADADAARVYASLSRRDRLPLELTDVVLAMQRLAASPLVPQDATSWQAISDEGPVAARQQWIVRAGSEHVAATRRRSIARGGESDRFVDAIAPILSRGRAAIESALTRRLPLRQAYDGRPEPVRLYAVSEDGTLVSAPWGGTGDLRAAAASEAALLAAHPALPTFAPEEFFFRSATSGPTYSGFYLDLGGRGLVSTVIVPLAGSPVRSVLALDLACAIDWQRFAETIEPPLVGTTVTGPRVNGPIWPAFLSALPQHTSPVVRTAVERLAAQHPAETVLRETGPLTHGVVEGVGAAAAFHVSDATWLLMVFPSAPAAFPFGAVALLGVMLALLLGGFEVNRRRAERQERKARRALDEKQNLLNTMQVPLMVVDPNTDTIVSSNRAAETLGIKRGLRFADLVWPDARARAHYEHMQVASPEPRRAYGVPIQVPGPDGTCERLAVVRSVAVTAPIEALDADERHRLGILFLLDPESDLPLFVDDLAAAAHGDERKRLSALLSHGMDTLLRVLRHTLEKGDSPIFRKDSAENGGRPLFAEWLAEYLERRLQVTAWLLDNWDAQPPPAECVVDAAQAHDTIARLDSVFRSVRRDPALRARLRWGNGPLAGSGEGPVMDASIDWPDEYQLPLPVRGGFGLFVAEVLTNAVRHGASGTRPSIRIACDPVRRELSAIVENAIDAPASDTPATARGESYGGLAILRAMARLFGWRDLTITSDSSRFIVSWRAPLTRRDPTGRAD
jgi:PAS domain-containing protein